MLGIGTMRRLQPYELRRTGGSLHISLGGERWSEMDWRGRYLWQSLVWRWQRQPRRWTWPPSKSGSLRVPAFWCPSRWAPRRKPSSMSTGRATASVCVVSTSTRRLIAPMPRKPSASIINNVPPECVSLPAVRLTSASCSTRRGQESCGLSAWGTHRKVFRQWRSSPSLDNSSVSAHPLTGRGSSSVRALTRAIAVSAPASDGYRWSASGAGDDPCCASWRPVPPAGHRFRGTDSADSCSLERIGNGEDPEIVYGGPLPVGARATLWRSPWPVPLRGRTRGTVMLRSSIADSRLVLAGRPTPVFLSVIWHDSWVCMRTLWPRKVGRAAEILCNTASIIIVLRAIRHGDFSRGRRFHNIVPTVSEFEKTQIVLIIVW